MKWIWNAGKKLRQVGILGMNHATPPVFWITIPRREVSLVDDKLRMHDLCRSIGVPTPRVHAALSSYGELRQLPRLLQDLQEFVIKPNRGSAGRGVLVLTGKVRPNVYQRHNGEILDLDAMRQHLSDIISGMYSLGGQGDQAMLQQRIHLHPAFAAISYKGIPDVRVILYRNEPAMAMLRLPTRQSNGRANLHQGGIGVGVDLDLGETFHAVQHNRFVTHHPDTRKALVGVPIPYWQQVLQLSRKVAEAVGLGYIGVDIVVDEDQGPMLLEANARPGLAIQIANGRGLVPRLQAIDALHDCRREADSNPPSQASIGSPTVPGFTINRTA